MRYRDDVELFTAEVVAEHTKEDGSVVKQIKWTKQDKPVNIGSLAKPNKKIHAFKYVKKSEPQDNQATDIFRRLMGK